MKEVEVKERILRSLRHSPHSLPARGLAKTLRVKEKDEKKAFYLALEELKREGRIHISKKHRIHLADKPSAAVEATILSLSRGFAFARPDEGGADIFIPAERLKNAVPGDRVLLTGLKQSPKGPSAEVQSVAEKSSRLVTGTLAGKDGILELLPDGGIRYGIPVRRKGSAQARVGDKVQAKIFHDKIDSTLRSEIVKVYGRAGSAKICADAILDQNGIHTEFPPEAIAEAKAAAARGISEDDLKGRLDLRELSICTIDGPDAKDLDDAISVSKTHNGYRLGVHIADVSHYIPEGGALDMEARERGTSVYFADRVVPMLPTALSNGVCSLNAGEDKLTFSAMIELDENGEILSSRFRKSVIRSRVRGVYGEVNRLFDGSADQDLRKKYAPVIRSLNTARKLASILSRKYLANGAVDLESTESEFTLNSDGVCVEVRPRKSGEAEQMIEFLMITANRAAAMLARQQGIPFIYRIHEQPNPERVESLVKLLDALGLNSSALKGKKEVTPADFSDILKQAQGISAGRIVQHQLLRTMMKARYSERPVGHFGLALDDYCHFTSPIRRYPDTAIHRILSAMLKTKDRAKLAAHYGDFAVSAAKTSSDAEVRAMTAERSAEDCYMAEFIKQHLGEEYNGVISGVTQRGVFVELENSVEGFVPVESIEGTNYRFDGFLSQVDSNTGKKLTIGMPMRVVVAAADVPSGRIDFACAGEKKNLGTLE